MLTLTVSTSINVEQYQYASCILLLTRRLKSRRGGTILSAQGKRQLSAYKNGEIKTLLADLLGLDKIREVGRQAAETAKLLKAGLAGIRQEAAGLIAEGKQLAQQRSQLGDTQARVNTSQHGKAAAQKTLDEAKAVLAKMAATKEVALQTEARRTQLAGERTALIEAGKKALGAPAG